MVKCLTFFYSSINNICVSVTISAVVSDHLALVAEIPVSVKQIKNARVVRHIYNYKKADFDGVRSMLSCLNWQLIESCADVDERFEDFYDFLFAAIKDHVPIVSVKNRKFPTWYDHDLISIVKDKEQAWKDYKLSKSADEPELYKKYTDLRRSLKPIKR